MDVEKSFLLCCPSCSGFPIVRLTSVVPKKEVGNEALLFSICWEVDRTWDIFFDNHTQVTICSEDGTSVLHQGVIRTVNSESVLWFKNCSVDHVADPCLIQASKKTRGLTVSVVSSVISHVVTVLSETESVCKHGVLLNERLCNYLICGNNGERKVDSGHLVGLYNIVDVTSSPTPSRLDLVQYVPEEFFEVAEEEEAMTVDSFQSMTEWSTRTVCDHKLPKSSCDLIEQKKWGHMIFLSHAWEEKGIPGSIDDLKRFQQAVSEYVEEQLRKKATNETGALVKNFGAKNDFGVWLDYAVVPNDKAHSCEECANKRRQIIAKMTALPSISTVIALHPQASKRGWILHEMTNNTHKNVIDVNCEELHIKDRLAYSLRINLMANERVAFTNGADGVELRCHEFIRLGQMPRSWPSVNAELLRQWDDAGITDERSVDAKDLLFRYARTFHYDCQKLKRGMAIIPQLLARNRVVQENNDAGEWEIVPPFPSNPSYTSDKGGQAPQEDITVPFDFEIIQKEIKKQEDDMKNIGIPEDLCDAASFVQCQQFIGTCMGMRAELLRGGGILHWISLSTIVQALAAVKKMVRLNNGQRVLSNVSCNIGLLPNFLPPESKEQVNFRLSPDGSRTIFKFKETTTNVPHYVADIIANGIPEAALASAVKTQALFPVLDKARASTFERHQSGKTPTWNQDLA